MARFQWVNSQYFDDSGRPLIAGKIYFYEPGTSTPKTTYSDAALSVANANPVVLGADGRMPDVFFAGTAKAVLKTSGDVTIETRDPVGDDTTDDNWADWSSLTTYSIDQIVLGSDGEFYRSLANDNTGNDPTSSPASWSQFQLVPPDGLFLEEASAAAADVAGQGQIWVKDDTPNSLYFTDDAGTDFLISGSVSAKFSVKHDAAQTNVTGDGTVVTVGYDLERFDTGADFDTGTYTFTAPADGHYLLTAYVYLRDITETGFSVVLLTIVTSNTTYNRFFPADDANVSYGISVIADMESGDTAYVRISVGGGSKVVDIPTSSGYFSGVSV